jgi:hypothetical protein
MMGIDPLDRSGWYRTPLYENNVNNVDLMDPLLSVLPWWLERPDRGNSKGSGFSAS